MYRIYALAPVSGAICTIELILIRVTNNIRHTVLATIFLLSVSMVYLISIACLVDDAVDLVSEIILVKVNHDDHHSNHGHHDHHSHSGHNHAHHSHNEHQHSDAEKDSEDEGCCKDEAGVYLSLDKYYSPVLKYNVQLNSVDFILPINQQSVSYNSRLEFYSDKRPPPNIRGKTSDIRVFVQSFQI